MHKKTRENNIQENSLDSLLHNVYGFDKISLVLISKEMSSFIYSRSLNCKEVKDMPNIKSDIKRVKTNDVRRAHNATIKSSMRTAVKKVEAFVANNDVEGAKTAYLEAAKRLDKAAQNGIIHKNAANRQKSRLAKKVNGATA